jgi:hypothetical protein
MDRLGLKSVRVINVRVGVRVSVKVRVMSCGW